MSVGPLVQCDGLYPLVLCPKGSAAPAWPARIPSRRVGSGGERRFLRELPSGGVFGGKGGGSAPHTRVWGSGQLPASAGQVWVWCQQRLAGCAVWLLSGPQRCVMPRCAVLS